MKARLRAAKCKELHVPHIRLDVGRNVGPPLVRSYQAIALAMDRLQVHRSFWNWLHFFSKAPNVGIDRPRRNRSAVRP